MSDPSSTSDNNPRTFETESSGERQGKSPSSASAMTSPSTVSIVRGLSHAVHDRLKEAGLQFFMYPAPCDQTLSERLAGSGLQSAAGPSSTTTTATSTAVFVGQVPSQLQPALLAWAINRILEDQDAVHVASVSSHRRCGCVELAPDTATRAFSLTETALFDATGVWIARTPDQVDALRAYTKRLIAGDFGEELLSYRLPKCPIVLRPSTANSVSASNGKQHPGAHPSGKSTMVMTATMPQPADLGNRLRGGGGGTTKPTQAVPSTSVKVQPSTSTSDFGAREQSAPSTMPTGTGNSAGSVYLPTSSHPTGRTTASLELPFHHHQHLAAMHHHHHHHHPAMADMQPPHHFDPPVLSYGPFPYATGPAPPPLQQFPQFQQQQQQQNFAPMYPQGYAPSPHEQPQLMPPPQAFAQPPPQSFAMPPLMMMYYGAGAPYPPGPAYHQGPPLVSYGQPQHAMQQMPMQPPPPPPQWYYAQQQQPMQPPGW